VKGPIEMKLLKVTTKKRSADNRGRKISDVRGLVYACASAGGTEFKEKSGKHYAFLGVLRGLHPSCMNFSSFIAWNLLMAKSLVSMSSSRIVRSCPSTS